MKITIATSEFYPMSLAAAIRMKPLVDMLVLRGHEVTIITTRASKGVKDYNIKTTFFQGPKNNQGFALRLLNELIFGIELAIRSLFIKTDLYIVTSPPFFMALIISWAVRIRRRPYVLDIRDEYPRIFKEQGLISESNPLYHLFDRLANKAYSRAHIVLGATAGIVKSLEERNSDKARISLFRNGYVKWTSTSKIRKREKFTVVFHGNLGKFQNVSLLLNVVERLSGIPEIEFLVMGSGSNEELVKEVKSKNLHFLGRIPHDQIMEKISSCHVGLSFRIDGRISQDSFPVKIYEYIGVGIPSIVTPVSEAGGFLEQNQIGFEFSNQEIDRIVEKILELQTNKSYHEQLTTRVKIYQEEFERHKLSGKLIDLLEESLA